LGGRFLPMTYGSIHRAKMHQRSSCEEFLLLAGPWFTAVFWEFLRKIRIYERIKF
jgi:hypothetical protein